MPVFMPWTAHEQPWSCMTPCSSDAASPGFESSTAFPVQAYELQAPPDFHEGKDGADLQKAGPLTEGEQMSGTLCSPLHKLEP